MSVICIIQARLGSTRFPGKVLAALNGHPVIWHVYTRCKQAVPNTVVAIPASAENDALAEYLQTIDAPVFRWDGPENDVLGRYAACLKLHPAEWVVRVTGDCPLVEPAVIRGMVAYAQSHGQMYASNIMPEWNEFTKAACGIEYTAVPSGFDVEVFTAGALAIADAVTSGDRWGNPQVRAAAREHVTTFWRYPSAHSWGCSVDTPADLDRIRALTTNDH